MRALFFSCLTLVLFCNIASKEVLRYIDRPCEGHPRGEETIRFGETYQGSQESETYEESQESKTSGILRISYPRDNWKCIVYFKPSVIYYGVVISFRTITFRDGCMDNVTLYSDTLVGTREMTTYCKNISDSSEMTSLIGNTNVVLIFRSGSGSYPSKIEFELTFTAYRKAPCDKDIEFTCEKKFCISKNLTCDGHNHCGDNSDQEACHIEQIIYIVGGVLGCLFLISFISFGIHCFRKRRTPTATNKKKTTYKKAPTIEPKERKVTTIHPPPQSTVHQQQPVNPQQQPVNPQHQPVIHWQQPVNPQHQPVIHWQQPVIHQHQPVIHQHQPVIHQHLPVIHQQQPVIHQQQPVIHQQQPVIHWQQPTVMQPQRNIGQQQEPNVTFNPLPQPIANSQKQPMFNPAY